MYDRRARFSEPSLAAGRGRIVFTGPAHCSGLPGARLRSTPRCRCRADGLVVIRAKLASQREPVAGEMVTFTVAHARRALLTPELARYRVL